MTGEGSLAGPRIDTEGSLAGPRIDTEGSLAGPRIDTGNWPGPAALAPFGLRLLAWAVDAVVVAVLATALVAADLWFVRDVLGLGDAPRWFVEASWPAQAAVWATSAAVVVLGYLGLGQAGAGRSIGKRVAGLRAVQVVRMPDGRLRVIQVRIRDALLRQVAHLVDLPLLWGFLRPRWDAHRRTMADQVANVFVVVDRDERCYEHARFLEADAEPAWWLCRQADERIWRGSVSP
jgi:RDD family